MASLVFLAGGIGLEDVAGSGGCGPFVCGSSRCSGSFVSSMLVDEFASEAALDVEHDASEDDADEAPDVCGDRATSCVVRS